MSNFDADIVVVGGGPSGLIVGGEAALGGAKVIILEKRDGPTWSRAGNIAPRVMEILASRGLADKLMARAHELHANPHSREGIWAGLRPLHYRELDTDYRSVLMFAQLETEKLLAEHFISLGGDMRLRSEVAGVSQDDLGVTVTYRDSEGEKTLRCRYLVGADGSRSAVREAAGIARTGSQARRIAVNVDAYVDNPHSDVLTVSNNERGWAMTYPLRDGVTRFAFIDAETMDVVPEGQLTQEAALDMLRRVHGTDYGIEKIDAINWFHDALLMAERIRDGRIFLVGESVRIHYPASGVGMNFCIQDGFNLGWKLAAAVAGRAPEWLLDSYATERLPEIEKLLSDVHRQCAIQFNFDPEHIALKQFIENDIMPKPDVNLMICENLAGFSAAYPAPEGSPGIVGWRLPNLRVREAAKATSNVFEMLRTQEFLLLDLSGSAELPKIAPGVRVRVAAADPGERAELRELASLLVRPDGHVAWAGTRSLADGLPEAEIREWLNLPDSAPVIAVAATSAV